MGCSTLPSSDWGRLVQTGLSPDESWVESSARDYLFISTESHFSASSAAYVRFHEDSPVRGRPLGLGGLVDFEGGGLRVALILQLET